tara:strand:- start:1771 stop:2298 length:528 start_codon:yes stop_codon:yes gene_type:complete
MFNEIFKNTGNTKYFSKGAILQRAGQELAKAFYVKKCLLKSYIIDEKGKEHIFMFASEGWIVSDIESQAFNNETVLFIEAIENSEVVIIEVSDFSQSEENVNEFNSILEALTKRIGVMQRRILSLMSASARERYESFLQTYPELPNRVPQKMIASYLGITPEALSTIRNKINKKD